MKKIILLFVCLTILYSVIAQEENITYIYRNKGKLMTNHSSVLTKMQVQDMFSEKQYQSYKTARNCYVASLSLFSLSSCGVAISTVFIGMGLYEQFLNPKFRYGIEHTLYYILAGATLAGTCVPLIPAIVLHFHGREKLNKLASDYNIQHKQSYQPIKLHWGLTDNGVGIKLTF